jgi:hypothetical protein
LIFVPDSIDVPYYVYGFAYVEPYLHPWNKINLIMMYDLFKVLLNSLCRYFAKNLHLFIKEIGL